MCVKAAPPFLVANLLARKYRQSETKLQSAAVKLEFVQTVQKYAKSYRVRKALEHCTKYNKHFEVSSLHPTQQHIVNRCEHAALRTERCAGDGSNHLHSTRDFFSVFYTANLLFYFFAACHYLNPRIASLISLRFFKFRYRFI